MASGLVMQRLIHDMLDEAISYGEYIIPKDMMEKLADASDYTLPDKKYSPRSTDPSALNGEILRLEKVVVMQHDLLQGYEMEYSRHREQEAAFNDLKERIDSFKAAAYLLGVEME